MPIDRIVTVSTYACMALCALNAADKIVGISKYTKDVGEIAEFIRDKEDIGYIDVEKVISLEPDIVIAYTSFFKYYPQYKKPLISAGIPIFLTDISRPEKYEREIKVQGWLLGKQERAEELVNFEKGVYGIIDDSVSKISEHEKPTVGYTVVCPCPYPIVPLGIVSINSKNTLRSAYIAKWLHPDRFEDLNPMELHNEWLDEFLGILYKGAYAYPTPWKTET